MNTASETATKSLMIARIFALMDVLGMSARSLSRAIGANETYIGQVLNGKGGMPSGAKLQKIAAVLGTTTDYLLGKAQTPEQPFSEVAIREIPQQWRGAPNERIPVHGTAWCDDLTIESEDGALFTVERLCLDPDHTVRFVERPPWLIDSRDAYAIDILGDSMEKRYFQGETAYVDPSRAPGPGDFVVVQINDGASADVITVLVKQLVRTTGKFVELEQFNPQMVFRVPRQQVTRMHRISGTVPR